MKTWCKSMRRLIKWDLHPLAKAPVGIEKMKVIKSFFCLTVAIMVTLSCGVGYELSTALPANVPIKTLTNPPSVIPRQARTLIPSPIFLSFTPPPPSFPVWVTDFSDPILKALDDQRPDIWDEFINFDKGWFYFIPDNPKGPFYARIQDESLLLQLPAENENRNYWVYNPRLIRRNFVLSFDLQFEESQPEDTVRFQFDQTAEQSVALDLSKNKTWALYWGSLAEWQSKRGTYDHFPPEYLTILIIVRGEECAVYLNNAPLTYLDNCRVESIVRSSPWAVTFHMLAEPGHIAAATIDNLKLWDLDKIPVHP